VVKKDINLQIARKTPRTKIRGQQTGKVKILQRRHMQSHQIVVYIVIIVTKQDTSITAGHDDLMKCTEKSTYRGYFKNALGKKIPVYLSDVLHVPGLNVNLLSITKCINKPGKQFQGTHKRLVLVKKGVRIDFEKKLNYGTGTLYASDITPTAKQTETAYAITEGPFAIINFDKFHSMIGHSHNAILKETEQANKIQLTGVHHLPCTH
jgi:hypothetical protein